MTEFARHSPTRAAAIPDPPVDLEAHRLPTGDILLRVRGSIDVHVAPGLESRLIDAAFAGHQHSPRLLLDLSGITFLDHAGLDALLAFSDRVAAASGTVELLSPSPSVVRLLHEAELDGESWMTSFPGSPDPPLGE